MKMDTENSFCRDSFWDLAISWNIAVPDFTECFQQIVLVTVPFACFSVAAIIYLLITFNRSPGYQLPWTLLNVTKIIFCITLTLISVAEVGLSFYQRSVNLYIPEVDIYANCTKAIAYALVLIILIVNKYQGVKSSTLLTLFWFVFSLTGIFVYRSVLMSVFRDEYPAVRHYKYALAMAYNPIVFSQFFLSLFSDSIYGKDKEEKNPVEEAPFFSFITFGWFTNFIYLGTRKLVTVDDFPALPEKLRAQNIWKKLLAKWNFKPSERHRREKAHNFTFALLKAFWPWYLGAIILHNCDILILFLPPLLLDQILTFMSSNDYLWKGYMFCFAMFLADFLSRVMYNVAMYYTESFALQLQSAVISAVYRKSMKLSSAARQEYTCGEIANLMAVDAEKIYIFFSYGINIFGSPTKILLTVFLLWIYLGPSCLSGVVMMILLIIMSSFVFKKTSSIQEKQMGVKDTRLKFTTEIMNGMKVLKLYAWEIPFMNKISCIRDAEVKLIRTFQICFAAMSFVWGCAPFLVAVACFGTFILVDKSNILDANTAFVSLNLLNILRYTVMELPELLADLVQALVSLRRVNVFLNSEECDEDLVGNQPDKGEVVSIRDATFTWNPEEEKTLTDINFHVPKGSFVAVIGPVGSGKSSMLSAVLGEMYKIKGSIDVQGSFAYVPQLAWVLNRTLQENILFVKPMDKRKYNAILDSCCLKPDLEILPGGDNTEIGEKGVNLSGGQKQRVSLARAVYHDADIYLLDDPLSAVDAHVGKHIFEKIIGKRGLLKRKTRILVTHNISILPEADCIYTMRDGKIEEKGTYDELIKKSGLFAELMQEHSNVVNSGYATDSMTESQEIQSPQPLVERTLSVQPVRRRNTSVSSATNEVPARLMEDERMEIGKVKKEAFINYARHMSFPALTGVLLGYFSFQAFEIGGNLWLSAWTSDPPLPDGTQNIPLRNERIGVYTGFGVAQGVAVVFGSVSVAVGAARASKLFHVKMLESLMKAPMSFYDTTPLGRIINRFGRDIDDIDSAIPMSIEGWVACFFSAVGAAIVMGISTPIFLAFLVPIGLVYYIIQKLYLITSRQLKRLVSVTRSPIYSHFTETVQGTSSVRAYKVGKEFVWKAEEKLDTHILCQFYWNVCSRWLELRLNFVGDLIILIAGFLAIHSKDTIGAAAAGLSLTYATSVNDILNWLVRTGTELENKSVAVERVDEYSKLQSEAAWNVSDTYPPASWPKYGEIEFKKYSTRYREGLGLVLRNVDAKINEGEKVGVVGRTGAGKSSFTLALFRIIEPVAGTIDIDGVNVAQIGLHQLRSKLTIIPQDPVLFTGRLRVNLDPNEQYTDDEVWSSLELANLKDFVTSLPEGLNHDISEGGGNLSVGQRQLICLARALLKRTKILILDEATAAVDVETDALIQNTIRTEFKENTVITIAHRLNTIMDYDKVLVMECGKISEVGNPSDLLDDPGSKFYSMAKDAGFCD